MRMPNILLRPAAPGCREVPLPSKAILQCPIRSARCVLRIYGSRGCLIESFALLGFFLFTRTVTVGHETRPGFGLLRQSSAATKLSNRGNTTAKCQTHMGKGQVAQVARWLAS